MVFRPPRAGGQSCGGVYLRLSASSLSSLFCTLLRGALGFFARAFCALECLETTRGVASKRGLAPVSAALRLHRDGRGVTLCAAREHKSGGSPGGLHAC